MERLRFTLQDRVSTSESGWKYDIPNIPRSDTCREAGLIKAITLVCTPTTQGIYLRWTPISSNRATREHDLNDLIQVSVAEFRPLYDSEDSSTPSDHKQAVEYLVKFLTSGIILNGVQYSFFGHSNSQLKSRACYFLAGTKEDVSKKVEALGDFSRIKTVAKKAKRIGLLFSSADVVQDVPTSRCQDIDDIEREGFIFTDGCGLISKDFVRRLSSKKPIIFRDRRYHPSVLQIRYQGYKGVVTVEPGMPRRLWLQLRKSMKKFSGTSDLSFAVVEYSKPYTYGYLNDEIVLLLHTLGIAVDVFLQKQSQYFDFLEQSRTDSRSAFRLLSSLGLSTQAENLLINGMDSALPTIRKTIAQEYNKMVNKREEQKSRILIPKSRLLFGICDPYGILKADECYLRVTLEGVGYPMTITGANVLVSRNPCLHPGDLRKLKAVDVPQLNHLTDCVIFSTNGTRPTADLMSGGDLDGDTFFVCWDPDLIPKSIAEAAEYPGAKEASRFSPITRDDLVTYFAGYNNMSLGRVKKLYLGWARAKGAHSSQCQELNRLFSQCVDGNRIKIPDRLLDPPSPQPDAEPFILDTLHNLALDHCRKVKDTPDCLAMLRQLASSGTSDDTERDTVEWILSNPNPFSDFELAKLILIWCRKHYLPFENFWTYFDTSQLAADEQAWLLSELPPKATYASHVKNGLLQSNILAPEELQAFRLDYPSLHWKCVFDSVSDPLRKLMAMVNQTFSRFAKKLLVLRLGERLSIAIFFPRPIDKEEDFVIDTSVRLFAFPHTHGDKAGHRRVVPTKKNYRFFYDENMMQLYESHRSNTFVFFVKSANDDSGYRDVKGSSNKARGRQKTIETGINCDWRVSIALGKFSAQLATHIGRTNREPVTDAELYVITNTDVRALRALDLWLECIDTLEVLPNFPDEKPPESLPNIIHVDWSQYSNFLNRIARHKEYSMLQDTTVTRLKELLHFGWKYNMVDLVAETYRRLLKPEDAGEGRRIPCSAESLELLVDFLHFHPAMAIHLARLCPWSSLPTVYSAILRQQAPTILRALIYCANKMEEMVLRIMADILKEEICLTLRVVQDLLETAALVIRRPHLLLAILVESRDVLGRAIQHTDPEKVAFFLRNMFGVVLDHCAATSEIKDYKSGSWMLTPRSDAEGRVTTVTSQRRIDAPKMARLAIGDHVRFAAKTEPPGSSATQATTLDAMVEGASDNEVKFRCLYQPPSWITQTVFEMKSCVPFVTTKTMGEALVDLVVEQHSCCSLAHVLLNPATISLDTSDAGRKITDQHVDVVEGLNESQSRAVVVATTTSLTCLWGPPGTGKTTTIIAILWKLLVQDDSSRILVTAPTHNAVDNVLRQFIRKAPSTDTNESQPLRVSTEFTKVSDDLKAYTCDAMLGKDLNQFPAVRRKAAARISKSRLVFTTCVGAALGLLRDRSFDTVIIDEASQQSEPASLIPLVKGCQRAILVGDHVQLRATVSPHAAALDFDVSLMERLWNASDQSDNNVARVMLDTQYRMHPDLCRFASTEFYDSCLLTAPACGSILIPRSLFPWPVATPHGKGESRSSNRLVFVQCGHPEDYGKKSKVNQTQAKLCKDILRLLTTVPVAPSRAPSPNKNRSDSLPSTSIAVLTPYSRQADLLKQLCPGHNISSIDGFQGQEADIVVFVTVRCNQHGEIGFLKDMRRLNVALTRAKAGLIIIGDQSTLTLNKEQEEACRVWDRLVKTCAKVTLPVTIPRP